MARLNDMSVTIMAAGSSQATTGTSANKALPFNLSGNVCTKARFTASVAACIRLGIAGVVATANDTLVQPGDGIILHIPQGVTNYAAIQFAAAGVVQVSPLEDA